MKLITNHRALASAIVKACQADGAKGVKQSTVLNTLTKAHGYRSIQAADAHATSTSTPAGLPLPLLHVAQITLLDSYPDSDLLGVDFCEMAGQRFDDIAISHLGAPLFSALWNLLIDAPDQVFVVLDAWSQHIRRARSYLVWFSDTDPYPTFIARSNALADEQPPLFALGWRMVQCELQDTMAEYRALEGRILRLKQEQRLARLAEGLEGVERALMAQAVLREALPRVPGKENRANAWQRPIPR